MPKITLIVGLPGSGKSHYGNSLDIPFLDDFSVKYAPPEEAYGYLCNYTNNEDKLAIADPMLCRGNPSDVIEKLTYWLGNNWMGLIEFDLVLFENDCQTCCINVNNRHDGRHISMMLIKHLSKNYNLDKWTSLGIPYTIKPCYKEVVELANGVRKPKHHN